MTLQMGILPLQYGSSRSKDDPLMKEGFTANSKISFSASVEGFVATSEHHVQLQ